METILEKGRRVHAEVEQWLADRRGDALGAFEETEGLFEGMDPHLVARLKALKVGGKRLFDDDGNANAL